MAMGVTSITQLAFSLIKILIYGLAVGCAVKLTSNIGLALIHAENNIVSHIKKEKHHELHVS
jgi:hypothetical protein